MARSHEFINGIAVGGDAISIVQYYCDDNVVSSVIIQPLQEGGGDRVSAAKQEFSRLVQSMKLAGTDAVCSLPLEHAVIKHVMADAEEPRVGDAIEWELGQQILGSMDEYVFDFQKLPSVAREDIDYYLAVAYRRAAVQNIISLLRSCRLHPVAVDLDLFALVNVFEANYPDHVGHPAVLVCAEERSTKLCLTQNGMYIDHDSFPHDNGSPEAGEYGRRLRDAVARLKSMHRQFAGIDTIGIYCAGSLFSVREYTDELIQENGPVQILYPFSRIQCRADISHEDLQHYAPQLSIAVGLALRGRDIA